MAESDNNDEKTKVQETSVAMGNVFRNDGSFLEMFKKIQEGKNNNAEKDKMTIESAASSDSSVVNSDCSEATQIEESSSTQATNRFVNKRRKNKMLPLGIVEKKRKYINEVIPRSSPNSVHKKDPWTRYMAEVKKYKQQSCTDEDSTSRPLVK